MKRLLLFFMLLCFFCQLSSAQTVYAFIYDHTEYDGIKSKSGSTEVVFIAVYNDMIGQSVCGNSNDAYSNWDTYVQRAIQNLSNAYQNYCQGPQNSMSAYSILQRSSELSTATKTTYRGFGAKSLSMPNGYGGISRTWMNASWETDCYTIYNDYSEMIRWWAGGGRHQVVFGTPENDQKKRVYYKHVTRSNLKPNIDFLYE